MKSLKESRVGTLILEKEEKPSEDFIVEETKEEKKESAKKVLFEKSQVKYFIQSKRVVDEHFNEFYSYNENDSKDVYLIDDTCLSIPIKFVNDFEMIEPHYDCGCILEMTTMFVVNRSSESSKISTHSLIG